MAFIITMAGLSSRFHAAGYEVPKYALKLNGRSLFSHSVKSFIKYFNSDKFIFVVRPDGFAKTFVKKEIKMLEITDFVIIELDHDTNGQAETLALCLDHFYDDFSIYVFNIDTIRLNFEKDYALQSCAGYLEVFEGEGDNWSFVEAGELNSVKRTAEKDPISNLCSNGLYYFRSQKEFVQLFQKYKEKNRKVIKEFYIAPVYNEFIKKGLPIKYKIVDLEHIRFCGTPQEYAILLESEIK